MGEQRADQTFDDIDAYVAAFSKEERESLDAAEAALDIAIVLHRAREQRGLSQASAARHAGLHQQAVSRLEQIGTNPNLATVRSYLNALGFGLRLTITDLESEQASATAFPLSPGRDRWRGKRGEGVLLPNASTDVNRGFAFMAASESANREHTIYLHADAIALWGRALTLYREGILGESDFSDAAIDPDRLRALHAQSQLLGLGVNSAKASLDLLLNGYYSPAFSTIRHMVETFAQCTWLILRPGEASRWFESPDEQGEPLDPPRMRELIDQIKADLTHGGLDKKNIANRLDPIYRSWKLLSKGAHPSGEGLIQTLGSEDGQFVVGGTYQPDLCVVALDHGLFAVAHLLPQALDWHKPQSHEWHEVWKRLEDDVSRWRAEMAADVSAAEEKLEEAA